MRLLAPPSIRCHAGPPGTRRYTRRAALSLAFLLSCFAAPALDAQVDRELEDYSVLDLLDMPEQERGAIVGQMCDHCDSKLVPVLLDLLNEDQQMDRGTRQRIVRTLELTVDAAHVGRLRRTVSGENERSALTAAALCGLIGTKDAVDALAAVASSEDRARAVQALLALGRSQNPAAEAILKNALSSSDPAAKSAAESALAGLQRALGKDRLDLFGERSLRGNVAVLAPNEPPAWIARSGWRLNVLSIKKAVLDEGQPEGLKACRLLYLPSSAKDLCSAFFRNVDSAAAVKQFLAQGGALLIDSGALSPDLASFLRSVNVEPPTGFKAAEGECVCSEADYAGVLGSLHDMYVWPGRLYQSGAWEKWSPQQLGVLRQLEKPQLASLIVLRDVAGRGKVIFNACKSLTSLLEFRDNVLASVFPRRLRRADRRHFEVSEEVVTPHVPWAKPLAGGKLRVLFILPEGPRSVEKRIAVELSQRMDLDYRFVPLICTLLDKDKRRFSLDTASFMAINDALAERPEVIVIGAGRGLIGDNAVPFNRSWEIFPYELKRRILRTVREGTGIVFLGDTDEVPLKRLSLGAPETATVPATLNDLLSDPFKQSTLLGTFGRGRGAIVKGRDAVSLGGEYLTPGLYEARVRVPQGEFYWSVLAKTVLWSSSRERATVIESLSPPREGQSGADLEVVLTQPPAAGTQYLAELRDKYNRVVETFGPSAVEPQGKRTLIRMDFAALCQPGVINLRVLDAEGRVLDWSSAKFLAKSAVTIKCHFDKDLYKHGETIRCRAELAGASPKSLACRLVDTNGRVMAATETVVEQGIQAAIELPVIRPVARLAYVEVEARGDAGRRMSFECFPIAFDLPLDPHAFIWLVWGDHGPLPVQRRVLGTDYVFFGDSAEDALAAGVGTWQSGMGAGAGRPNGENGIRKPCLSSPAFNMSIRSTAQALMPKLRRCGTKIVMLQDETVLGEQYCRSRSCLARFRRYLRDQYGSLDALNRAWETAHKSWDEAVPMTLEEVKARRTFGPFVDHRTFMSGVYAGWIGVAEREIREFVPDARVGLSGVYGASATGGFDAWQMSRTMTLAIKYLKCKHQEYERSLARPDLILSRWYAAGYSTSGRNEAAARYEVWRQLFRGSNALSFWARRAYLSPDLTPFGPARWAAEESNEIKDGIDKLLFGADRNGFGIGVHYSHDSWRVNAVLNAARKDGEDRLFVGNSRYERVLEGLRIPYTYIASQQVEVGELIRRGFKVIILPYSVAISDREVMELRRFAESGGTIIADFPPGDYNPHGVPRAENPMLAMFGVRRAERRGNGDLSLKIGDAGFGKEIVGTEAKVNGFASDLVCADAVASGAVGGAPALMRRPVGKGQAVLLNFHPYYARREEGDEATGRALMAAVLKAAGIAPAFTIDPDISDLHTFYYRRGQGAILAVHHEPTERVVADQTPVSFRLGLPEPRHVYAVRARRYVGQTGEIASEIVPAIAQLYALLPYRVDGVKVSAQDTSPGDQAKLSVTITVSEGVARDHVLRLQVADPAGRVRQEYAQTIVDREGRYEAVIPIALNDPEGTWEVAVRDVMTGVTGEGQFELKKAR